jgi:hypothetical protein
MNCEYCNHSFVSKISLSAHQKTAKYCLALRNVDIPVDHICEGCGKKFTRSYHLERHQKTCSVNEKLYTLEEQLEIQTKENRENKLKLEEMKTKQNREHKLKLEEKDNYIQKLELTIKDLQDRIEKITLQAINRPTHQTKNKQIINLASFDLTQDKAKIIFANKYTPEYFLQGMKGLARFVSDHIVKTDTGESIYACYDRSRDVFKYKNEAGEYINDIKAVRLVEIIHPAAAEHGRSMNDKFHEEYMSALSEYDEENITNKITQNELDYKEMKATQSRDSNFLHKYLNTELDSFSKELGNNIK